MSTTSERAPERPGKARRSGSWHETRALLRAHLSASADYGHFTGQCAVCYRLLRLAMESPESR